MGAFVFVYAYCPNGDWQGQDNQDKPDRCPKCGEWTTLRYEKSAP